MGGEGLRLGKGQAFEEISVPAIPGSEISYGFAIWQDF